MEQAEVEALIRRRERTKIDFKAECRMDIPATRDKRRSDLAWDVAAMANTRGGPGHLVIGIDEKTGRPSTAGVRDVAGCCGRSSGGNVGRAVLFAA